MAALLLAGAAAALCVVTRWYLDHDRRDGMYARGYVRLTALRNQSGAFGVLRLRAGALAALSAAALAGCLLLYRRSRVALGLLLGGGASNLWERARHGSVYDYVQFPKAPGPVRRYVWNLADFFILLGAIGLLLEKWQKKR